ncbi:NAD(P)H-dependent FMN reductase LOT6 [Trichoderma asperellum]|uniref:NAD(P)H-dependent FMN reductase LOT6 n=1 Tax=Trichoderma asperellum TaxID=101201 RepID=A0A6V8R415_TRIAP|nr:flavoprotein-like protein [Trichoderma asperelloides]GFP57738.1 NAD(P)H-dependent FMN reductase LOT6 [Trichoderma asperellum]
MVASKLSQASVAIIITSTRTPRVCPKIANIIKDMVEEADKNETKLSLVDLADFKLPIYDETVVPYQVPSQASYANEHSRRWSAEISKHDAYVLVIPEYNYGMAGSTKNAIDYLRNEWIGKPAAIVSYGMTGGKNASEQVKTSLEGTEMCVSPTRPQLVFFKSDETSDIFTAMHKGELGERSREIWTTKDKQDILKAFEELKEALKTPSAENRN